MKIIHLDIKKIQNKFIMKYEFMSQERVSLLEETVAFLQNLTPSDEVIHVITTTNNKEDWNIEKTNLLHELQIINKRRKEILNLLK